MRKACKTIVSAAMLATICAPAAAQDYPSDNKKIVADAAPDGGHDLSAHQIAKNLKDAASVSVIVDSKPGANGTVAISKVTRAISDSAIRYFSPMTHRTQRFSQCATRHEARPRNYSMVAQGGCNVLVVSAASPPQTHP